MNKAIYTKYSPDRIPKFNIVTSIYENENKKRWVEKRIGNTEAKEHLDNIFCIYENMQSKCLNPNIKFNTCTKSNEKLIFDYVEGKLFSEELDDCLKQESYPQFLRKIQEYYELLTSLFELKEFRITESFVKLFGSHNFSREFKSTEFTNVDLTFDNLILKDKINIIDYEWTFSFPIPLEFVFYRALKVYKIKEDKKDINILEICKTFNITKHDIEQFDSMEQHFQDYVTATQKIHSSTITLQDLLINHDKSEDKLTIQVFYDYGQGYTEENSRRYELIKTVENSYVVKVPIDNSNNIRIDPMEEYCYVDIQSAISINLGGNELIEYKHNGLSIDGTLIFLTKDPQIIFNSPSKCGAQYIEITFKMKKMMQPLWKILKYYNKAEIEYKTKIEEFEKQLRECDKQLEILNKQLEVEIGKKENLVQELNAIKNSKSWKLINKFK